MNVPLRAWFSASLRAPLWASLLAVACLPTLAHAQVDADYPHRSIKLIVPFAAGSATDTIARIIAKPLGERLGQSVVVEPRPGADGRIGVFDAARAKPNGYTLLMGTTGTLSTNPAEFKKILYDPINSFAPILLVGEVPFALVVNDDVPVKTTAQLIAYARGNPGDLFYSYASPMSHFAGDTLLRMAGIYAEGVPYKSSPQAAFELIGGQTQFYFIDFGTGLSFIKNGKIRALAVADQRTDLLPGVPAVGETVRGFSLSAWTGILAPAGTPPEIVDLLNNALQAVLAEPEVRDNLQNLGFKVLGTGTPDDFSIVIENDLTKWTRWVNESGIERQ